MTRSIARSRGAEPKVRTVPERSQIYADTTVKYRKILKQEKANILLSNHFSFDSKMATLKNRMPKYHNPFVLGDDAVQHFLTVFGECTLATKAFVDAGQPGK